MFHLFHTQLPFIVNLLILLLSAKILGEVAERLGQPAMIGEVIAGVILGPSLFNIIPIVGDIKPIADLGVFLLIFMAGMEIEPEEIRNSIRGKNLWIGLLGFAIPMGSGFLVGHFFHFSNIFTIFLSLCIAITALPVSIRILVDLGKLQSDVGQRIISAAIFNDMISLMILGIILDYNGTSGNLREVTFSILFTGAKLVFFIFILIGAYRLIAVSKKRVSTLNPKMEKFLHYLKGKESMFAMVILFVLIFASIAELLGLHFIVGAFFGALLFPRSMFRKSEFDQVKHSTSSFTMGFLAPIFFAIMGVQFDATALSNGLLLTVILAVSFLSKILGGYFGARLAGFHNLKSITIGLGLNARGIMELVIANIALQKGFIDIPFFSILVMMALLTTLITPFLLKDAFIRIDKTESP
ncbi:MAG: cation:proton antiporter [Bacteroidota bacterium]|jgi:Kef-type K+ transport system membrane component KefB